MMVELPSDLKSSTDINTKYLKSLKPVESSNKYSEDKTKAPLIKVIGPNQTAEKLQVQPLVQKRFEQITPILVKASKFEDHQNNPAMMTPTGKSAGDKSVKPPKSSPRSEESLKLRNSANMAPKKSCFDKYGKSTQSFAREVDELKCATLPVDCNFAKFVDEIKFVTKLTYKQKEAHSSVKRWQKMFPMITPEESMAFAQFRALNKLKMMAEFQAEMLEELKKQRSEFKFSLRYELRSHIFMVHNAMIKIAKKQKPQTMYAGFYNFSLKGRTSQREIRERMLSKGHITVPYFISCSNVQEENMKDYRIIIQEEKQENHPAGGGPALCHQSCKVENGNNITGYFVPMTKFSVVRIG